MHSCRWVPLLLGSEIEMVYQEHVAMCRACVGSTYYDTSLDKIHLKETVVFKIPLPVGLGGYSGKVGSSKLSKSL